MVKDKRDLAAVFSYLRGLSAPVGNLYLVSHANADGTLSPKTLEHPETVDERRAKLGMEPMADAMAEMASRRCR